MLSSLSIIVFKGLKTGMYYLRTRAASDAIKFTVDTSAIKVIDLYFDQSFNSLDLCWYILILIFFLLWMQEQAKAEEADLDEDAKMAQMVCSLTNRDECLACGS